MELTLGQIDCLLRAGETESIRLITEIENFNKLAQEEGAVEFETIISFANNVLSLESLSLAMAGLAEGLTQESKKEIIKETALNNASKAKGLLSDFEIEVDDERTHVVGILTLFPKEMLSDVSEQEASILENKIDVFLN